MVPINKEKVQQALEDWGNRDLYVHLETTNGAYSARKVGAYIRNSLIRFSQARITGDGAYRVGLKMDQGWVYAEGLTDWELDDKGRLLLAGHDEEGRLAVALQLSPQPF